MSCAAHLAKHLTCRLFLFICEWIRHVWIHGGAEQTQSCAKSVTCMDKQINMCQIRNIYIGSFNSPITQAMALLKAQLSTAVSMSFSSFVLILTGPLLLGIIIFSRYLFIFPTKCMAILSSSAVSRIRGLGAPSTFGSTLGATDMTVFTLTICGSHSIWIKLY